MKRYIIIVLLIQILFLNISIADAGIPEPKILKVGWYLEPGMHGYTENGDYTGYMYEYYQALAKYGNFKYEFVEATRKECLKLLQHGDLDLLASVQDNEINSDYYGISDLSAGLNTAVLYKKTNCVDIVRNDFKTYQDKRIGIIRGSDVVDNFEEYMKKKNFSCIFMEYKDIYDLEKHVDDYEMFLTTGYDVIDSPDFVEINRITCSPIHLTTSKNNSTLLASINRAMSCILEYEPELSHILNAKYYNNTSKIELNLSDNEQKTLYSTDDYKFYVVRNNGYLSNIDVNNKFSGIQIEYINELCSILNIKNYTIIETDSLNEAIEFTNNDMYSICCDSEYDQSYANKWNVTLSTPYVNCSYYSISQKSNIFSLSDIRIAAVANYSITDEYIKHNFNKNDIIYFNNFHDCLQAVANNQADITFCNSLIADYYTERISPSNFERNVIDYTTKMCFSFNDNNKLLASSFSKAIAFMDQDTKTKINTQYSLLTNRSITLYGWLLANPYKAILIFVPLLLVLLIILFVLNYNYITIKKNNEISKLLKKNMTDSLTGIYNRVAIETLATADLAVLSQKQTKTISVFIMIDIDNYKNVNDTYGHNNGDLVLKGFSNILTNSFNHDAIVSRMGGDEFSVFIKDLSKYGNLDDTINIFLKKVSEANILQEYPCKITCSAGYATTDENCKDFQGLYHNADIALYTAKESGKNNYCKYDNKRKMLKCRRKRK